MILKPHDDLATKFHDHLEAAARRLNIPVEFTEVFQNLFLTRLLLSKMATMRERKSIKDPDLCDLMGSVEDVLSTLSDKQSDAMRALGSSFITEEQFTSEITLLEDYCNRIFRNE